MANSEIGLMVCPKCLGDGDFNCSKCKGKRAIDWIENIVGIKGTYIKPGVYVREIDLSEVIPVTQSGDLKWKPRMRRL